MSKKNKKKAAPKKSQKFIQAAEDHTTILSDTVRMAELQHMRQSIQTSSCLVLTFKTGRRASDATQTTTLSRHQQEGHLWFLLKSQLVLGRCPTSDIYIDDLSVSKKHALFEVKGEQVYVTDLGSTNKTTIGAKDQDQHQILQAHKPMLLKNKDDLCIGRVQFNFFAQGTVEAQKAHDDFKRAYTDPLTRIHNRRYLNSAAYDLFKKSQNLQKPLSLMVFDIDFFKKINDTYGHDAGDFVLKKLAALIGDLVRNDDIYARFGGEEFVLLFSESLDTATDIAWRMNKLIASTDFNYQGKSIKVCISAGVTTKQSHDHGWEDLLRRADTLLYQAKNQGRNLVIATPKKHAA